MGPHHASWPSWGRGKIAPLSRPEAGAYPHEILKVEIRFSAYFLWKTGSQQELWVGLEVMTIVKYNGHVLISLLHNPIGSTVDYRVSSQSLLRENY